MKRSANKIIKSSYLDDFVLADNALYTNEMTLK